uniref:Integrase catalytic domain-containing protein n=1 Tax=Lepisosteus oculatus TaxID=7918 RepID=W5MTV9_LEPOC
YYSRGPNNVWHIDGYDKLKPYGICINGCIDGFLRKMIWLEAYKTNNDPLIIAGYFIDAVYKNNGLPQRVRLDHGTENTHVAVMQRFLREMNEDSTESVTLGPSTGNQRIERWWATLSAQCSQFWMDNFEQLREDGHFVDTFIDKSLIQFCFQNTIQEELNEVLTAWNNHRIRPTHNPRAPSGRPSVMYAAPSLYGAQNYLQAVDQIKVDICREDCCVKDYPCDEDVFHLCVELMAQQNFAMPDDVFEITDLYLRLCEMVLSGLDLEHYK